MKPLKITMSAFGPYADLTVIDFDKYLNGLYIITGDTGAGKTTIFDAITFALYGEASTERRENSMLRSDFAGKNVKTFVELEFMYRGEIYKIYRNPRYKRDGLKTEEMARAEITYPDGSVRSGVKEVNSAVRDILGIDCGQFTQISMIAQGDFLKLLLAGTEERGRIFREIFNTDFYRNFQDRLKTSCNEKHKKYEEIKTEIENAMNGIICDEPPVYNALQAEDFIKFISLIIQSDAEAESCSRETEKKLREESDDLSIAINTAQRNNDLISALNSEKETLETLEKNNDNIENQRRHLERAGEINSEVVPVYQRIKERRKSIERLSDLIEEKKSVVAANIEKSKLLENEYSAQKDKDKERKELSVRTENLKNELDRYDELEALLDKKTEAEKLIAAKALESEKTSQEITGVADEITEIKSVLEKLKMAEVDNEIAKRDCKEKSKNIERLNKAQFDYETLEGHRKKYAELRDKYIELEEELGEKSAKYNEQYNLFLREQAGIIAETLTDGKPCPVCGSVSHPQKAHKNNNAPTEAQLRSLKEETELLSRQCREYSEKAGSEKSEYDKVESSLKRFVAEFDGGTGDIKIILDKIAMRHEEEYSKVVEAARITEGNLLTKRECEASLSQKENVFDDLKLQSQQLEKTIINLKTEMSVGDSKINSLKTILTCADREEAENKLRSMTEKYEKSIRELEETEKAYNECLRIIDEARAIINNSEPFADSEREKLKSDESDMKKLLEKFSLEDESEIENCILSRERQSEIHLVIEEHNNSLNACMERIKVLEETIETNCKTDIEELRSKKEERDKKIEEVSEHGNNLRTKLSVNKKIMERVCDLRDKMEKASEEYGMLLNLSQTASGELSGKQKIAFEQYIQSAYFRSILNEANKRFGYMTNGRFELIRRDTNENLKSKGGLEIDVFDNYTGKSRDVKTLSGGESFKASLCMALGLSEIIQRSAGGVKLESMFVDEGFGVLDGESLEQAVEVLTSLSVSDRMVGIISHISELKDRIDKKIIVKRNKTGSVIEMIY